MRLVKPLAEDILVSILDDPNTPEHVSHPMMRHMLSNYAYELARVQLLQDYADELGLVESITEVTRTRERVTGTIEAGNFSRQGRVKKRSAVDGILHQHMRLAAHYAAELGLTPMSQARIGKNVASTKRDLASMWGELARAEQQDNASEPGDS